MGSTREEQALIWDYYKSRQIHAWNMLVLSMNELNQGGEDAELGFDTEYCWENFIIRLWLYRTSVRTLGKLDAVKPKATRALNTFDDVFKTSGRNGLKALRDMIEHFDDYAGGTGRGPGERGRDLDPWRTVSRDRYERGRFVLDRSASFDAATKLHADAKRISDEFIQWYKS